MAVKSSTQEKLLQQFISLQAYQPFVSHSSMGLVRWFLATAPQDFQEKTEEQVRQSLYHLKRRKYIKSTQIKNGNIRFSLTERGKQIASEQRFRNFNIVSSQKWDGKWRFVSFDVPRKSNYARNILRDKLKKVGFFRVQHSLWAFPHDCHEEIDSLASFLNLQNCVLQFTGKLRNDDILREHFRKSGVKI